MVELDKEALEKARLALYGAWSDGDFDEALGLAAVAIDAYLDAVDVCRPIGHVTFAHDGFSGDIIGHYTTREGKRGVVVQQDGTRVVHVYGEKWLSPISPEE